MQSSHVSPEIRSLRSIYRDGGGDFEELLEYGDLRYHLLLKFNSFEPDCIENDALKKVYDAIKRNDDQDIVECAAQCLDLFWTFIETDYESRLQSNAMTNTANVIKLQLLTRQGVLRAVEHNSLLEYPPTKSVDNTFPRVPTFRPFDIELLNEIEREIFQIKLHSSIYCLKTVHRTGYEGNFIREVTTLQKCRHPNIIRLVGLLVDENAKVEGMIIEYVPNARSLRNVDFISSDQYDKWASQIRDAIAYLHRNDLVLGDAKAANVLIRAEGNVVLIDFGGGYTKGWVDSVNYETVSGDLQGCEEIIKFMREKTV